MKQVLTILLLLCGGLFVYSQNTLNVWLQNNEKVSFTFAEKPVVNHTDNVLTITSTSATVEYPVADVQRFTFEDAALPTKILNVTSASDELSIYDTQGILVRRVDDRSINLDNLPHGIYIIKSKSKTFKVIKK